MNTEETTTSAPETTPATETTATVATPKEKRTPKAKAPKAPDAVIEILSASYGIDENRIEVKDLVKVGRKITNKLIGSDPAPKAKKLLIVTATVDGVEVEKTFAEGDKLTF
jgi:hypothetical protein